VTPAIRKSCADYFACPLVNNHLSFQGMSLLLSRVVVFLPLLGRSTGVSVTSINTTSYSVSLFNNAFLPGVSATAKCPITAGSGRARTAEEHAQ